MIRSSFSATGVDGGRYSHFPGTEKLPGSGIRAALFLSLLLVGGVLVPSAAWAQAAPKSVEGGRQLFATSCKPCHGEAGIGMRAPALRGPKFTVPFVRGMVNSGKPGTLMPKFSPRLNPEQIEG